MPCPLPSPQAGTLTCELSSCPYCTSALEGPELEFSDSDSGDSDSNGVYEFTQDVRHGDHRDPMQSPPVAEAPGVGGTRRRGPQRAVAGEQGGLGHVWASFSGKLRRIVDSKYFNRGIMVAILTNTLSMGVEYHEQVGAPHRQPSEWPWGTSRLPVSPAGFSLSWAPQRALSGWGIGMAVGLKVDCEGVFTVHSADAPAAHWWASAEWRQRDCGSIRRSSVWAGALRSQTQRQQGAEGTCQAIWCFSRWDSQSPAFMDGAPHMSWAFRLGFPGRPQRGMWQWHMVLARGPCPGLGLPQGAAAGLAGRGRPPWGPRPVHS